jgi:hypothetical protein
MVGTSYGPKRPAGGGIDHNRLDKVVLEARQGREARMKGYREQSLRLHPWVCGRCGREFTHPNLHELTVHHKDHNHDNNPPDGSNWENLCLYCHDNEHQRQEEFARGFTSSNNQSQSATTHNPFADLKARLKGGGN